MIEQSKRIINEKVQIVGKLIKHQKWKFSRIYKELKYIILLPIAKQKTKSSYSKFQLVLEAYHIFS